MSATDFWKVDYPNCYFIQGGQFKGDYFRDIPEFPVMLSSLEEAQAAALSVIEQYAVIRIMKEEMLVGRIDEKVARLV